jgi:carbon storage regulator
MLILSRKPGERIRIGPDVTIVILRVRGNAVQIGCVAPDEVPIDREEVRYRIDQEQIAQMAPLGKNLAKRQNKKRA